MELRLDKSKYTTQEVMRLLGVSRSTLRGWVQSGKVPLGPVGESAAGRGHANLWSAQAVHQAARLVVR